MGTTVVPRIFCGHCIKALTMIACGWRAKPANDLRESAEIKF
jgi:hypothetical protein